MAQCGGTLLIHHDGSVAACTEELAGCCCPGPAVLHAGGSRSCTSELGADGCELCSVDRWLDSLDWDHIVKMAVSARSRRLCLAHAGTRQPTIIGRL